MAPLTFIRDQHSCRLLVPTRGVAAGSGHARPRGGGRTEGPVNPGAAGNAASARAAAVCQHPNVGSGLLTSPGQGYRGGGERWALAYGAPTSPAEHGHDLSLDFHHAGAVLLKNIGAGEGGAPLLPLNRHLGQRIVVAGPMVRSASARPSSPFPPLLLASAPSLCALLLVQPRLSVDSICALISFRSVRGLMLYCGSSTPHVAVMVTVVCVPAAGPHHRVYARCASHLLQ